ncbi:MAG: hypothetical protein ACR2J1_00045 [Methyloceanibacter sp.]|uniref:hypothetical protein n=1 Tax=Methyloceanibacter sp. TaxID=1965321 RepID=UPI003D9B9F0A
MQAPPNVETPPPCGYGDGAQEIDQAGYRIDLSNKPSHAEAQDVLTALLHPPTRVPGVPFTGLYSVSFRGEFVVKGSRNPECDLALALFSRGITGSVQIIDANTGAHRSTIPSVEKAAGFTVEEGDTGPRFVKRRQRCVDRPLTAETDKPVVRVPHRLPIDGMAHP